MSENTTETVTVFNVKITGKEDFRAVAPVFGVDVPTGPGAMPKRQLLLKVRDAVKAGKATLVETDYFGVDAILSGAGTATSKTGGWEIHYRTVDAETGKPGKTVQSITVGRDKIKSVLPDASFQGAKLNAVIALVMVASAEGAGIAELKNYVVTDVTRVDSVPVAEPVDEAPKGDDTSEDKTDTDKPSEPAAEVKPETVADEIKVPVPAESKPRTRKTTAKPAAKSAGK